MTAVIDRDIRFTTPLYTVGEAARALGVSRSTLGDWAKGYRRQLPGKAPVVGAPILTTLPAKDRGDPTIPFVGLAEGMVLAAVRAAGVPLQRVRPALEQLARQIGIHNALASERLYTDGAELLYELAEEDVAAPNQIGALVVVRSGQRVFTDVIAGYLKRIDYGPDGYARLVRLPGYDIAEVIADPSRSFGQPIFARGGARLSDALGRFWAGEDLRGVSEEFGVPLDQLEDAVRVTSRPAA